MFTSIKKFLKGSKISESTNYQKPHIKTTDLRSLKKYANLPFILESKILKMPQRNSLRISRQFNVLMCKGEKCRKKNYIQSSLRKKTKKNMKSFQGILCMVRMSEIKKMFPYQMTTLREKRSRFEAIAEGGYCLIKQLHSRSSKL